MSYGVLAVVERTEPITWELAVREIRRAAVDEEEFERFVQMVAPKEYRCAVCDKVFVVPSLARDCEQMHEEVGHG